MKFAKVKTVKSPARAHPTDAGIDFYVPSDFENVLIWPGEHIAIESGIKVNVPAGYALVFFNKSGVAVKSNLAVGACVVDETYQGEIHLHLYNFGNTATKISPNQKIAQGVLLKMFYDTLEETSEALLYEKKSERGEGRFGSTNKKD